ncbi:MAG: DMT family transporter [Neomegalonema sp.]|nr:DMT family transporter [Neomegalonema sp.]
MSSARKGLLFFLATMVVFALQDGVSKILAQQHSPIMIVMIRYWAFAAFVVAVSASRPGGLVAAVRTKRPFVQAARGLLLAFQIMLMTYSFAVLGLAVSHSVLAVYPLLIAAFGAFLLGERVSLAQWLAVAVGFVGVLILVDPSAAEFDPRAAIPLVGALMFATYSVLTRWVGSADAPSVSFFYTGVFGALGSSLLGPFFWSEMTGAEWGWMALLCVLGASGHYLLIRAYENSEAGALQPFAYLQLVIASFLGVGFLGEQFEARLLLGASIVVAAGLFALLWGRYAALRKTA